MDYLIKKNGRYFENIKKTAIYLTGKIKSDNLFIYLSLFLNLRVFELFSSLLYSQRFCRRVLRPSSSASR